MKIGETLLKEGVISPDQLESALHEQEKTHDRLGDIVLKMGFATPESLAPVLANYFQIPFIHLEDFYKNISAEVIDAVSKDLACRFTVIPLEIKDGTLTVATADPLNLLAIDTLKIKTGYKIKCVVAAAEDIKEAIEYCYQNLPRMKEHIEHFIQNEIEIEEREEEPPSVQYGAGDQPVVEFVKSLIVQAVNNRASDILLRPKEHVAELRFRIDGMLYPIDPPPKAMLAAINTRIKILAGLDIAERRLPQDGRFKMNLHNGEVDIRTSTFPTIYGESVVMRLLDTAAPLLGLGQLGFAPEDLRQFRKLLCQPHGLILVTGPTGSGKTTTLYAALNEIKSAQKNIITLEDPVEYRLAFIQQSQVNPLIGFDFARGLRSILRQDPDVIMVGEIRDRETAEIAIHAALTGHLVFSTLHTNDAAGAPIRLINMGVEPFLLTSSLLGVIAQRLIRTICPDCREASPAEKDLCEKLGFNSQVAYFFHGKGCPKCMHSGYRGRKGLFEVLIPNAALRQLILEQSPAEKIRATAQKNGMRTLCQAGLEYLKNGQTTLEELLRVTQQTQDL